MVSLDLSVASGNRKRHPVSLQSGLWNQREAKPEVTLLAWIQRLPEGWAANFVRASVTSRSIC